LDRHAREDGIELRLKTTVDRIDQRHGAWRLRTPDGDIDASQVVIATGYEHTPFIPELTGRETFTGEILHSSAYRRPGPFQGKRVLVVGCGSSGIEIVHDVATGGAAKAWLSVRTSPWILPRRGPGGLPSDFIATALYHIPPKKADVVARLGRRLAFGDLSEFGLPIPEEGPFARGARLGKAPAIVDTEVVDAIRNRSIEVVSGVHAFSGSRVMLTDGKEIEPDVVICATGYRRGLENLVGHLGVLDEDATPKLSGETPAAPGLRFIGFLSRPALLGFVAKQSKRVANHIRKELEHTRTACPSRH
jgi:cation diffusion facilitator CzcD-associated flavoprotein CzcO